MTQIFNGCRISKTIVQNVTGKDRCMSMRNTITMFVRSLQNIVKNIVGKNRCRMSTNVMENVAVWKGEVSFLDHNMYFWIHLDCWDFLESTNQHHQYLCYSDKKKWFPLPQYFFIHLGCWDFLAASNQHNQFYCYGGKEKWFSFSTW